MEAGVAVVELPAVVYELLTLTVVAPAVATAAADAPADATVTGRL